MKMICRLLIVSLMFLSFHSTAGMIGTDQVVAASPQSDRANIQNLLSRAEIASQLQSLGVDVNAAKDRVAAMTDDEARSLAGKASAVIDRRYRRGRSCAYSFTGASWKTR